LRSLLTGVLINFLPPGIYGFILKWGALFQMWIPGITSIVFRFIFGKGFKDIGWKVGGKKFWIMAILIPLSVPVITYLFAFIVGTASLAHYPLVSYIYRDILNLFTIYWPIWFPQFLGLKLLVRSIIVLTVGLSINFVFAFGEELGWRGYLQQRIIDTGFKFPYALCGLIWAGWHLPFLWWYLVGSNSSNTLTYQTILFTLKIIFLGIIAGRLRMESGSIWIPTLVHAAHNAINFELFAAVIFCSQCELYVSENGIIMGLIYGVIVLWMLRSKKQFIAIK
jgi:uncharacterized protein